MIISKDLAQNVVDNLMEIVQRNVNIMDCGGIIIASGQPHRLNTFHQGGKMAVDNRDVVEIYPETVHRYAGALPGVMWPIELRDKVVGVVGVTGEPPDVRKTAKLVKTVTELILEREIFLADYRSENRAKEQLVTLLFSDNPAAAEDAVTLAEMLNYKLHLARVVILIKLEPKPDDNYATDGLYNLLSARIREHVSKTIKEAAFFTAEDISLFFKKNLCIIKTLPDNHPEKKITVFIARVAEMLGSIQPRLKIRFGIGSRACHPSLLCQSYQEALFALEFPGEKIIRSINDYDILLDYLFDKSSPHYNTCLALRELKPRFEEISAKYDLPSTLDCLLANNMNITLAARQLFIHRNTLKFRLEKLKKITGLEPCRFFRHALLCRFLLSLAAKRPAE